MHRLTLGWLNCPDVAAPALVDVAADAGFDSVGVRITGRRRDDGFPSVVGDARALRTLRARASERGVTIHNASIYHLYPDVQRLDLERALDAAAEIDARMVLVAGYDADRARLVDRISTMADAAATRALRLFIEFVPFSEVKSLPEALALVRDIDRPNLGITIDPLHLARSGGHPGDVRTVPSDRLYFVQLCDALPERPSTVDLATEARTRRMAPGDGSLPLDDLLDAVPADIDVECEFPTEQNLALAPVERARAIRGAAIRFLERHASRQTSTA